MSLYNLLFGQNPNSDVVLAIIGLKQCDISRFRDCFIDFDKKEVAVFTRMGGGNRDCWSEEPKDKCECASCHMRDLAKNHPLYLRDKDDDFDCTYATYYFRFPATLEDDVMALRNPAEHGLSSKLISRIVEVIGREPTDRDKEQAIHEKQGQIARQLEADLDATIWNGHTIVPLSDRGMEQLLKAAEENNGEFRYSIRPYQIEVKTDTQQFTFDKKEDWSIESDMNRVFIAQPKQWKVDEKWWGRWKDKFSGDYPLAIAAIQNDLR